MIRVEKGGWVQEDAGTLVHMAHSVVNDSDVYISVASLPVVDERTGCQWI